MTDYEARIRAILDTSDVNKTISSLQNQKISMTLDLKTGNVSIDAFLKNVQSQMKTAGQQAGNTFTNALGGGLKTWSNNSAHTMQELQRTLAGFKFNRSDINRVTQDLEHMNLEISKVTTRINNNNLQVRVSGIDELGRAVTIVKEFDHRAGELSTVGKVIAQSFDTSADGAKRFQAEVDSAFARMKELGGRIGTLQKDLIKLDPGKASDVDSINAIVKQIDRLKQEYQDLQDQFGGHFTQGQNNALTAQFEKTFDEIELLLSKLDGLRTKEAEEIKLKISTDQFKADISSVEAEISKLTATAKSTDLSLGVNHDGDINKLKTDLAELKRIRDEIEKPGATNADIISNYEQYNTVLERVKNGTTALKKELDGLNATQGKASQVMMKSETLSNKMTAWMNQNAEAAKQYGAQIEELQGKLKDNTDPKAYQEAALAFQKIQAQAKAAGLTVNSFGASVKNAVKQILGLTSAVAILSKVKQIFKDMYQQLYEIDTSMTNLYKVTDETSAKYASFLKNAKQDAQELGRTVSSLVEQTATWAKLGYNIDQAALLSKVSSMYANVGEVGDDTAVSDLVTSMKAFNIEAEKAITIVDPLNELGNNFATSAGDLGAGLKKSASTLSLAGVSLNEALAMLTGGAEITQNAQEFGNALKVAVMRIRGGGFCNYYHIMPHHNENYGPYTQYKMTG